jgi:hypothetical protein
VGVGPQLPIAAEVGVEVQGSWEPLYSMVRRFVEMTVGWSKTQIEMVLEILVVVVKWWFGFCNWRLSMSFWVFLIIFWLHVNNYEKGEGRREKGERRMEKGVDKQNLRMKNFEKNRIVEKRIL